MALNANELFASAAGLPAGKRVEARTVQPKTFAAGTGTLKSLTPVAFNTNTNKWQLWGDPVASKVIRIKAAGTVATDGTFTLTVDDETTDDIDHDATAAAVKTALVALDAFASADITVYETDGGLDANDGYVTIIFHKKTPTVTATFDLTGADHVLSVVAEAVGEISVITANATPASDGDFTITVNGETTGNLDHDDTPADIQAALEALGGIDIGDVIVFDTLAAGLATGGGAAVILFTGNLTYTDPVVSITMNLTGNDHVLSTLIAGAEIHGQNTIRGFVFPDDVVLNSSDEVLGNVLMEGKVHYDDIVLPSGEAEATLKDALRTMRERGIIIQGLDSVH